jgi:flagellar biosynthesis/type III secretory pathway chaperone
MEELIKLLDTLKAYVAALHQTYGRLVDIMDAEEKLISEYNIGSLQNLVVEKDQVVQRSQKTEEKRAATLKRICFLIAFDARNTLPSVSEFNTAFEAYLRNIETLVDEQTLSEVKTAFGEYASTATAMQEDFTTRIAQRIRQNKIIIEKVRLNFQKSIRLFENIGGVTDSYNKKGLANSDMSRSTKTSLLRVQV